MTGPSAWPPSHRWTPPLTPNFRSAGDRLLKLLDHRATPAALRLDTWQVELYRHLLELCPPGHPRAGQLRFRRALVSMARQNGKSTIASDLALYGLLQHSGAPRVVGIATSREQARIVYERTHYAVTHSPLLSAVLTPTTSRGIKWRDGRGGYQVYPTKAVGVQGEPVTYGIADELHIMPAIMWDSLVHGQKSLDNAQLLGITTAGDSDSLLLRRLEDSMGDDEETGVFIWRAPADEVTEANIAAANPAVACGRIPPERVLGDIAGLPALDVKRYTLNRWTDETAGGWADYSLWDSAPAWHGRPEVAVVSRSQSNYGSIAIGGEDGSALVWRNEWNSDAIAAELELLGLPVVLADKRAGASLPGETLGLVDTCLAWQRWWSGIVAGDIGHDHNPIVKAQLNASTRKHSEHGWRVASDPSDALTAVAMAAVWKPSGTVLL